VARSRSDGGLQDLSGGRTMAILTFIVMFRSRDQLPAIVRTREFDVLLSMRNYDATLSDWRKSAYFTLPFNFVTTLNARALDTTIQSYAQNCPLASDASTCRSIRPQMAAKPAPADKMNYHGSSGHATAFYVDSNAIYTDMAATDLDVRAELSLVTAAATTHDRRTDSYLVAFDSPAMTAMSQK